jgi:hypothetical protein
MLTPRTREEVEDALLDPLFNDDGSHDDWSCVGCPCEKNDAHKFPCELCVQLAYEGRNAKEYYMKNIYPNLVQ